MEIGMQIRKYRLEMELSQEELAQKIYVTRQTVSNWENEKNYPDIHSLVLLSSLFNISLDQLIKGDIERMKKEINNTEIAKFNRYGIVFSVLFIASIIAFVPLLVFFKSYGAVIWVILYLITLGFGLKVEKLKKENDLHTYREIVAFSEGMHLDEIQKQREIGKRPYQAIMKPFVGAAIGILLAAIAILLTTIR